MIRKTKNEISDISVAVIGSGYWGKNLVRNFHELGCLRLICDKDENILAHFREQYPQVETCMALSDVLQHNDIQAVAIATPAETHFALAREALLAGKHVFIEKPLALNAGQGEELVSLADKSGRVLMVGHILQYHPAVVKLKELIDSGELGKIQALYSNRLNIGKIRAEENILWSFAPHDISAILMLLGEMPENVYASGGCYLQQRIPDTTMTIMDFPSGVKAHIFVSWLHPFKEQKLVVVGDRKMAVFDDTVEKKLSLYPHKIEWLDRHPVASKAEAEAVAIEMEEPLKAECEHFLHCIANAKHPRTDGQEGLRVLQVLQACQASLDGNGRNVRPGQISKAAAQPSSGIAVDAYFVHESAYIDSEVQIGEGTKIWHFSHVLSNSSIGRNCNIGQNVVIGPNVTIGYNCKIQNNVSIYKGVTLEAGVFCGPSMVFTNVYNPRAEMQKMDQLRPTLVKQGATIGANATIVCGTTLGRYCFVGAGTLVNQDVSDHALVVGNPGKQKGWVCQCGERLEENLKCLECKKSYAKIETGLVIESV